MDLVSELKKDLLAGKEISIVFIGDSITSTEWVHPNWREIIEYVLKEELTAVIEDWKIPSWGIRCINHGYDGSTTEDILARMDRILNPAPYITVFMLNTNDRHAKLPMDGFRKNVQRIVDILSEKSKFVIFTNTIPGNRKSYNEYSKDAYADIAKDVKLKKNTIFIDTFSEYQKHDLAKLFTFVSSGNPFLDLKKGDIDYVHPNQLGNAYIAKIILEKAFNIGFDPERYIKETGEGKMFPEY